MPVVDYLPIANAAGAAVEDQASYAADATLPTGYPAGIVPQNKFNKSWRQVTVMMAAVANYISQQLAVDVLDDGNVAALVAKLTNAIVVGANIKPARVITASANFNILPADYHIGLARTVAPAAVQGNLPTLPNTPAAIGQEFVVEDLLQTFSTYPVTIVPPAGQSIAGLAQKVLNIDGQSAKFTWYGNNLWSVAT
jgi:hypothetical protein